jgi:predicted thioesterase
MSIEIGLKGLANSVVTDQLTAQAAGSGTLAVYGTPYMVALMEQAASTSLVPYLEPGQSTVGVRLDISHLSATPVGMEVGAESEVIAVDGKKVIFRVRAYDRAGLIGEGMHERVLITADRFVQKCYAKLEASDDVH